MRFVESVRRWRRRRATAKVLGVKSRDIRLALKYQRKYAQLLDALYLYDLSEAPFSNQ